MSKLPLNKKILHVLRNDAQGGLENSTLEVVRYFAAQEIQQHVVILSPLSGGISQKFLTEGIKVTSIAFKKKGIIPFCIMYWRFLREIDPDAQLISGAYGLHALLSLLARTAGVKNCWTYLIMGPATKGFPYIVQLLMGQIARLFSSGEISISEYLKSRFHKLMLIPLSRIHVVYRWRDIDAIEIAANEAYAKNKSSNLKLVTISRLDWMKDLPNLIIAFSFVARSEPDAHFYIVGEGPMRSQLEELVAKNDLEGKVFFLGHRENIPELLGSSDIFLFSTSATEGLGGVMIEAMAAGTPFICTDTGPCREVMGDGLGGVLVPPGDPEALSRSILALWRDPDGRTRQSKEARIFARNRYTSEIGGHQLLGLLLPKNQ